MAQAVLYGLIMQNEMASTEEFQENGHAAETWAAMNLTLRITDPEVLAELGLRCQQSERQLYALGALRVGIIWSYPVSVDGVGLRYKVSCR